MLPRAFGPYELTSLLGVGGMGEVYRARDRSRDRWVAVKLLAPVFAQDPEYINRFRRESFVAARLRDPHVIPIHDFGEIDGQLFIDMRLVDGRDIGTILAEEGPLAPARAVGLLGQIAEALDAAHAEQLVHRDVKPSNLLVTKNDFVYVVDFGVARSVGNDRTNLTVSGATVGTLDYMAPERFTQQPIDGRADVYSLACVLYECLTAERPFRGGDLPALMYAHLHLDPPKASSVVADVPPALDAVIRRGMAKRPQDRFATAPELAAAAHHALVAPVRSLAPPTVIRAPETVRTGPAPEPAFDRTPTPLGPPPAPVPVDEAVPSRHRWRVPVLLAAAVLLVVGVGVFAAVRWSGAGAADPSAAASGDHPTVVGTVPAGETPGYVDVTPDGKRAYVANRDAGTVTVLDTANDQVVDTIAIADGPAWYVRVSPDGQQVYVSVKNADQTANWLVTLDTETGRQVDKTEIDARPFSAAVTPDGRFVWVASHAASRVDVVDTASDALVATIPVASDPHAVALSPDGRRAYVANHESDLLTVLDTRTRSAITTVDAGDGPYAVAVSPDGDELAVADYEGGTVTVVDTAGRKVLTSVPVGGNPQDVAWAADGKHLYAVDNADDSVSVIDTDSFTVTDTVAVGTSPTSIAVRPDGERAYVTNSKSGTVSVLDLTAG
ncbi:serine/threonine-protein kinase [Petropleomorpha daqingensis]|uniref:non-specific serine/threonine protein kinase n=1 Tax=Petropleomorpha daqingensis TaxID=2026353 RepID=A0A853C8Z4_9ACTN|nr:serine/threonine-protein kinase [Petropleomorpha daqingensis]NYJ04385.1 serine/threonine-protein kinase [Petropleomorpha daqingensis]